MSFGRERPHSFSARRTRGVARQRPALCLLLLLCAASAATGQSPRPVLLSEPTSTRALALESVTQVREPFATESIFAWGDDRRTRLRLFAMNLTLRPGEDASAVSAFAEDGVGRRYELKTEYVGAASGAAGAAGVGELILRLSDDLGDVGDVLVWVVYGGAASNRVRVGVGHVGGGPADDAGAVPTQPLILAGTVTENNVGRAGVEVTLTGGASPVTQQTAADGSYSFVVAPLSGYTLTPREPPYVFVPAARSFDSLKTSLSGLSFNGTRDFVLSGRVADADGRGVFGVTVFLGGAQEGATYTDADGYYYFFVTSPGDYTLTPFRWQRYYTFSPAAASLNGVAESRTADFTASLASASPPSYVLEFDGTPKTVDYSLAFDVYGFYWPWDVDLGHFFWEVWAMPGQTSGATYLLSDGYGGAHALLFGFANIGIIEPGRYQLMGNVWDGAALVNFNSDEGPAPGEWGHYAVGWDGQYVVMYLNGVPVGRTRWGGPRRSPGPAGGGGRLYVGGSNHNNLIGRVAQVRGYEGANPREGGGGTVYTPFRPETVFGAGGNLLSWYFRPSSHVEDLSRGYQGVPHAGALRGWTQGETQPCLTCPLPQYVVDPTAPNFADPEHPGTPPAPAATPAPVPDGALVFDSFTRRNSTYALGGVGGLGSTEGGRAGVVAWQTNVAGGGAQPFGVLNGRAVLLADARALAWVSPGPGLEEVYVRADRKPVSWAGSGLDTGLCFRVADADNFFFAYTSGDADTARRILTVGYYAGGRRTTLAAGLDMPEAWTTLRVLTNAAGLVEVYADDARLYAAQNSLLSTSNSAGLYNDGPGLALANRWDNFTVFGISQR